MIFFALRNLKEKQQKREQRHGERYSYIHIFAISSGLIAFGAGLIIPYVPTWLLVKFSLSDNISGPVLAAGGITVGLAASLSPRLAGRLGLVHSATITMVSSLAFMVSLACVSNSYMAVTIYIIRTMLMNMSNPLMDTLIMNIARPENRGFVSALVTIVWRLPNSFSTILAGVLLNFLTFDSLWLIASLFYVIGIAVFYIRFKGQKF
jgi:predicted MFS family arabinose efflux permease